MKTMLEAAKAAKAEINRLTTEQKNAALIAMADALLAQEAEILAANALDLEAARGNVPAAVLLSGFTDQWKELLAGVNIGGLGTPIASLASLITLKLYMRWPGAKVMKFIGVFMVANIVGLVILLGAALVF